MEYYCGLDGGGTGTRCAIAAEGRIIARGKGGCANIYAVGETEAKTNILRAIRETITAAGLQLKDIAGLHMGAAGLGKKSNLQSLEEFFRKLLPDTVCTLSDDAALLLPSGSGIAVIAGTGSIAIGQNCAGERIRAGGFGWRLGDEGSAFHIAKEAARRTLRSLEGMDLPTGLDQEILDFFPLRDISGLIYYFNDEARTKKEIADFSVRVIRRMKEGDPLAADIIAKEEEETALLIESIISRLEEPYEKHVILSGGVLIHNSGISQEVIALVKERHPEFSISVADEDTALLGALEIARRNLERKQRI